MGIHQNKLVQPPNKPFPTGALGRGVLTTRCRNNVIYSIPTGHGPEDQCGNLVDFCGSAVNLQDVHVDMWICAQWVSRGNQVETKWCVWWVHV